MLTESYLQVSPLLIRLSLLFLSACRCMYVIWITARVWIVEGIVLLYLLSVQEKVPGTSHAGPIGIRNNTKRDYPKNSESTK